MTMLEKTKGAWTLRELDEKELTAVYETHMRRDFPKDELKPLRAILDMRAQGAYDCLGMFEEDRLCAYAYMVKVQEKGYLLLDYLAACADVRGQGNGSRMLAMLRDWYREENGIFLESECLRTSADEAQMKIRWRRLNFYRGNGCVPTQVKALVYGVEYDIFYIPLKKQQTQYREGLEVIYRTMFSERARKAHVRVWERRKRLRFACGFGPEADRPHAGNGPEAVRPHLCRSLTNALGIRKEHLPRVICLAGAGGKTTTMYQLADELAEMGKRVLVTTSTHIARPKSGVVLEAEHVGQVTEEAWTEPVLIVGRVDGEKLAMPEGLGEESQILRLLSICDVILAEADGAACHPLKVPRDGEPVILPRTELLIGCAGLSCIGKTWAETCFRFEQEGGWLEGKDEASIRPADLAGILADARGTKKDLPKGCEYRILLNQADDETRVEQAVEAAASLPKDLQKSCVVTAYERETEG